MLHALSPRDPRQRQSQTGAPRAPCSFDVASTEDLPPPGDAFRARSRRVRINGISRYAQRLFSDKSNVEQTYLCINPHPVLYITRIMRKARLARETVQSVHRKGLCRLARKRTRPCRNMFCFCSRVRQLTAETAHPLMATCNCRALPRGGAHIH